jgi:hypothetical protein
LKVESKVLKVQTLSTETVESGWCANRENCSLTPTLIPDLYIYVGDWLAWNPFEHFSRMVLELRLELLRRLEFFWRIKLELKLELWRRMKIEFGLEFQRRMELKPELFWLMELKLELKPEL